MERVKLFKAFPGIISGLLISLIVSFPVKAEFVFLNDGGIIEGTVTADSASYVILRTPDKKEKRILRKDILRVLYTRLSLGKVYLQKRDGTWMELYIVDEDQEMYVCRKDLYKPEEFTIKRNEVLFIADKNPSGLDGIAGIYSIDLSWHAPYNKVKQYTVYIKKAEKDKYESAGNSDQHTCRLKNLESNTCYWIIVTATDMDDQESIPSNEIRITTNVDTNAKKIELVSIDSSGFESDFSEIKTSGPFIGFSPGIMVPAGKLKELAGPGYGGFVAYSYTGLFINRMITGIDTGYFYLTGIDRIDSSGLRVEGSHIIPLMARCGYQFNITGDILLKPALSAGYAYIDISYTRRDESSSIDTSTESKDLEPVTALSLMLEWFFTTDSSFGAYCMYGMFMEQDENLPFAVLGINFRTRF